VIRTVSPSWKRKYRTRSTPFLHSWASGRGTEGSNPSLSVTEPISPVKFRGCRQRARKIQATRFPIGHPSKFQRGIGHELNAGFPAVRSGQRISTLTAEAY
jgi:hypothetical protein